MTGPHALAIVSGKQSIRLCKLPRTRPLPYESRCCDHRSWIHARKGFSRYNR